MSLVTQCPACGTTFKVVRDQLRISEGWVRCGQCAEVFDSAPNLREVALAEAPVDSPVAPWAAPEATPSPAPTDDWAPEAAGAPGAWKAPGPLEGLQGQADITGTTGTAEATADLPAEVPVDRTADVAPDGPAVVLAADEAATLEEPMPMPTAAQAMADFYEPMAAPPASAAAEPAPEALAAPEPAEAQNFSFIQQAKPPSAWHRPWARAGLLLVGLVLGLLLALQVVVQERDRIAASDPDARRLLLGLCGLLHCQIQPWRQIEAMAVDASGFNKLRGDTYRLSFVVKNTARLDLARPAIELTLTDTQDQPLLRRVLLPGELSPQAATLAAGAEWAGSYLVSLAPAPGGANLAKAVAGYRLLAFYP